MHYINMFSSVVLILAFCSFATSEHPTVCPLGYDQVDRKCFKILGLSMTFFEAFTACDVIDGKLVQITSKEDQARVTQYLTNAVGAKQLPYNSLWMGATNLQGKWMFLSSKNQNAMDLWTSWAPGNPKAPTMEDPNNCGALTKSLGWNWENLSCSYHQGALCYVELREDDIGDAVIG